MPRYTSLQRLAVLALACCGVTGAHPGAQNAQRASYYHLHVLPGTITSGVSTGGAVAGYDGTALVWRTSTGSVPLQPLAGWSSSWAYDVLRSGRAAGRSFTGSTSVATIWDTAGVPTAIVIPGATDSSASAISRSGLVVGNSNLSHYGSAWVWDALNGARNLSSFGVDPSCTAADVNTPGQVVGGQPFGHAYRFDLATGIKTDLGTLNGGLYSSASGVNDRGHVVGRSMYAPSSFEYTPFLWTPEGGMQFLGTLAPPWMFLRAGGAEAINDDDVIVGSMDVQAGHSHAFVWDPAYGMRDLNELVRGLGPYELIGARDVSNDGWIVGWAYDTSAGNALVYYALGPQ